MSPLTDWLFSCLQVSTTEELSYAQQLDNFARGLAASLTIAAFDIIFPTVFQQLALLEMWRTPRTEVRATLLRYGALESRILSITMTL